MPLTSLSDIVEQTNRQPDFRSVDYTMSHPGQNVADLPAAQQFPYIATSYRDGPAQWVDNRDRYVQQYTGSAYIAINTIAKMAAMQKIRVLRRKETKAGVQFEPVSPTHPLVELFEEVNPQDTTWTLLYSTIGWLLITGNAYIYKARNGFGTPKQLWPMPSQWIKAIPDPVKYIKGYTINSQFGSEFYIPENWMVDIRMPSLDWSDNGRYYGQPAIKAASTTLDLENEMLKRLYYQFKNFAPPSMVFETDQRLQPTQVQQLWAQFAAQHSMSAATGRPMIVHSGMKLSGTWNANSDKELSYADSLDKTLQMTFAALGIPPAVVGLMENLNKASADAALLLFAKFTLNPLIEHLSQHLTQNLAMDFAPDRSLIVQIDPCEVDKQESARKAIETLNRIGGVTPNEGRHELMGWGPLDSEHGDNPVMISGFQQSDPTAQGGTGQGQSKPQEGQVAQVSRKAQSGQNQSDMGMTES